MIIDKQTIEEIVHSSIEIQEKLKNAITTEFLQVLHRFIETIKQGRRVYLLGDERSHPVLESISIQIKNALHCAFFNGPVLSTHFNPAKPESASFVSTYITPNDLVLVCCQKEPDSILMEAIYTAHKLSIPVAIVSSDPSPSIQKLAKKILVFPSLNESDYLIQLHCFGHLLCALVASSSEEILFQSKQQLIIGWEPILEEAQSYTIAHPTPTPLVSVVIPTMNRSADLLRCVEKLLLHSSLPLEILVMDDSADGSQELVREHFQTEPRILYIHNEKRRGLLPCVNLGLALSVGKYHVGITDDIDVFPNWDIALLSLLEKEPSCGAVVPLLLEADGTIQSMGVIEGIRSRRYPELQPVFGSKGWNARGRTPQNCPESQWVRECDYGCISFLRAETLKTIGGYDLRYQKYCADPDFCMRIRLTGLKILYCPQSIMIHHQLSREEQTKTDETLKKDQTIFREKWGIFTR